MGNENSEPAPPDGFLMGMSRSGTTWLALCLSQHPNVAVFGETLYWGRRYVQPQADGRYSVAEVELVMEGLKTNGFQASIDRGPGSLQNITQANIPSLMEGVRESIGGGPTPSGLFSAICEMVRRVEKKPIVFERTPHHVNSIERIGEAYPEARYLISMREPYGFMVSYKYAGNITGLPADAFDRFYHPIACATVWRRYARAIQRACADTRFRTFLVDHADISRNGREVLESVCDFLGLEFDPAMLRERENSSFDTLERPSVGDVDRFWMNAISGRAIKSLGFELRRGRVRPLEIARSLATLPRWSVGAYRALRFGADASFVRYLLRWLR